MEVYTWSWPIQLHETIVDRILKQRDSQNEGIVIAESNGKLSAIANGLEFVFDLANGVLLEVKNGNKFISFNGGPIPVGMEENELGKVNWKFDADKTLLIEGKYVKFPKHFYWNLRQLQT